MYIVYFVDQCAWIMLPFIILIQGLILKSLTLSLIVERETYLNIYLVIYKVITEWNDTVWVSVYSAFSHWSSAYISLQVTHKAVIGDIMLQDGPENKRIYRILSLGVWKCKIVSSMQKIMLTIFWYTKDVSHTEFLPKGMTIKLPHYMDCQLLSVGLIGYLFKSVVSFLKETHRREHRFNPISYTGSPLNKY